MTERVARLSSPLAAEIPSSPAGLYRLRSNGPPPGGVEGVGEEGQEDQKQSNAGEADAEEIVIPGERCFLEVNSPCLLLSRSRSSRQAVRTCPACCAGAPLAAIRRAQRVLYVRTRAHRRRGPYRRLELRRGALVCLAELAWSSPGFELLHRLFFAPFSLPYFSWPLLLCSGVPKSRGPTPNRSTTLRRPATPPAGSARPGRPRPRRRRRRPRRRKTRRPRPGGRSGQPC